MVLDDLREEFKFKLEKDPKNFDIQFIKFEDGREYKLQHPKFFELLDALNQAEDSTALTKLGIKCLFPMNEKSPRIDENWLEKNQLIGINLWSALLRGLLQRPPS